MAFDFSYITFVGFLAQGLFFSRFAAQLFLSEKSKASLSPTIFWQLSMFACCLMMTYGFLRDDFSIIEGQLISYFIYVRNLQLKNAWKSLPKTVRIVLFILPIAAIFFGFYHYDEVLKPLFSNPSIPPFWLILGTLGQTIFASRFIYQWLYSEYKKESIFPLGFWVISIVGSAIIISYAIFTKDIVLLVGQGFGLLVYSRNFYLRILENKKR